VINVIKQSDVMTHPDPNYWADFGDSPPPVPSTEDEDYDYPEGEDYDYPEYTPEADTETVEELVNEGLPTTLPTTAPTTQCQDQVMNGDESDTDCGGSCAELCLDGQRCMDDSDCRADFGEWCRTWVYPGDLTVMLCANTPREAETAETVEVVPDKMVVEEMAPTGEPTRHPTMFDDALSGAVGV
jgi:hypothetical protein